MEWNRTFGDDHDWEGTSDKGAKQFAVEVVNALKALNHATRDMYSMIVILEERISKLENKQKGTGK